MSSEASGETGMLGADWLGKRRCNEFTVPMKRQGHWAVIGQGYIPTTAFWSHWEGGDWAVIGWEHVNRNKWHAGRQ